MWNCARLVSSSMMVLTMLLTMADASRADGPAATQKQTKDGQSEWRMLFDGKTLKNWAQTDFGGQGAAVVKDGLLILERGEPLTGINWVGPDLPRKNYEITLDAKRIDGNDFFAALTFPVEESACTLVLGGWGGGLIGISSINGSDASENETTDYYSFEKDQWYPIRIRVTGDHIQAWIKDRQIANVNYSERDISVRIEMELSKPLGLASFQTTGAVRDFKIRDLSK